ncbi:hypothetical protein Y1Q_0008815 [Alligator mississippiensis]|uniref:Uncharacterized protein n=1 Tax=Alligator mississippiensis TaxID=8496 RepID=A0A151NAQ3_ALLMI|nr:hypothetical protein Y1Q_0008815 [Alligator mississippiensis]
MGLSTSNSVTASHVRTFDTLSKLGQYSTISKDQDIVTGTTAHNITKELPAYLNGLLCVDEKLPRVICYAKHECVFPYGVTTGPKPMLLVTPMQFLYK